ncbi:M20/M25/M40 family metallo-hydrolase [Oscillospiraceae bacterium LTW-04]|nr:M20/M25/M40 family metallo-hydrolase [Oscillospiraceae bacterium MB24-C1]
MMVNNERLLATFLEYVQIDSETGNEKAFADRMVQELKSLGGVVTTDNAGEALSSNGYNIYSTFEGTLPGEPILFSAHMDTVKPGIGIKPVVVDGVIRSSGDTILASDDKSGIAGIIEAIRSIKEKQIPHRTFEVIFTICEEGGLRGAKQLDYSRIQSKKGVALDSSGNVGKIIAQAPGQIKIYADVIGKTAHAGIAPETGISAIQVAAHGIAKMKLLRLDEETTANIGTINAQYATNIVPDKVSIIAETRSRNYDKLQAQAKHMVDCLQSACDEFGANLECRCDTAYVSYNIPHDHVLVKELSSVLSDMGIEPIVGSTGGGSDVNIFNLNGIDAVVLATGMSKVHTTNEFIEVRQLELTAEMMYRLMTDVK